MRFYTTVKLGPNRELTPEGFVLFKNVSVARTGEQIYGPQETGIEAGEDGLVHIFRSPDQVFRPETLASLNGKPFVILHPDEDVTPDNWQHLANGVWMNARRGDGEQKDDMVADLLVTTKKGIAEIDLGLREISLGYDADYFQTAPGRGEQRNIIINHGAAVDEGRCGPQCAVRDSAHKQGACMKKGKSIRDRILAAFKTKDEAEVNKALDELEEGEGEGEDEGGEHHVHVHIGGEAPAKAEDEDPVEARFKGIESGLKEIKDCLAKMGDGKTKDGESEEEKKKKADDEAAEEEKKAEDEMAEEAEEGTRDQARKAKDSALLVDSFERTKMDAEIIAPGVKIPTFDAKADPKTTFRDCICALRRAALRKGIQDSETAELIEQVRGRTVDSAAITNMPCGQLRSLFNGVAALKRHQNNSAVARTVDSARKNEGQTKDAMTRFKEASRARWAGKK